MATIKCEPGEGHEINFMHTGTENWYSKTTILEGGGA